MPITPHSTARPVLPRQLHDFVVELAIAVQKRTFYPATHPILQGAVEGVHTRLAEVLAASGELSLGVADRQFVVDGQESDEGHPLLSEFASRLGDHQVGAVRFTAGITRDELDAFVAGAASPADGEDEPFATRTGASTDHVTILPVAFDRLGLLDGDGDTATEARSHEEATWQALAAAALQGQGTGTDGVAVDPRMLAEAIGGNGGTAAFDADVIDRLSSLLESLGALGAATLQQKQRVSALVESLGTPTLTRLLQAGGPEQGTRVVRSANDALAARAVIELVSAASAADALPISGSMLRLLQKLSSQAQVPGARGAEAERVLRGSVHRLLDSWTLANPNPELYEKVLETASAHHNRRATDARRDVAEPERIVDLALETQVLTSSAEVALGRLALREGLAVVLDRLQAYPDSPVRESMIDRLVNEASMREYLDQPVLDVPLMRHAVDRIRARAIGPLVAALERRSDSDAPALIELLARLGWDALEPLGRAIDGASPRMLRHLFALFDRMDAWPPQVNPRDFLSHPDAVVRREAIRFLLRSEATQDVAIMAALRDREVRTFSLGLSAVAKACSPSAGRLLMARYQEPELTPDLRQRMVRAIAVSGIPEAPTWLGGLLVGRRWILGRVKLRKPSPETIAAAASIVHHFPGTPLAAEVVALIESSRMPEYRRAITRSGRGAA